jgi:hypothetical protein
MDFCANEHIRIGYDIHWDKYNHYNHTNCGESCRCCLAAKQIKASKKGYSIYVPGACTICLNVLQ